VGQPQTTWSDDRKWWWDGTRWRPATESQGQSAPVANQPQTAWSADRKWLDGSQWRPTTVVPDARPRLAPFRSRSGVLPLIIGKGLLVLAVAAVYVSGACGPSPGPSGGESITVEGTGDYDSKVFSLNGGSYVVSWQVQQTAQGANVPCSIDANLWSEAGYYQRNLITETSGPADAGAVTLRIPQGNWTVEVTNSCGDSHSVVQIQGASS
jgi:hypothetical protein